MKNCGERLTPPSFVRDFTSTPKRSLQKHAITIARSQVLTLHHVLFVGPACVMASLGGLEHGWTPDLTGLDSRLIIALICSLLLLLVTTRYISGNANPFTVTEQTIPGVPYWLPLIGHAPHFLLSRTSFLASARKAHHADGAFAVNLAGRRHNIIFEPELGQTLLGKANEIADVTTIVKNRMHTVFGWPSSSTQAYDTTFPKLIQCHEHLRTELHVQRLLEITISELRRNINNLVTFSASPVDQMPWERPCTYSSATDSSGRSHTQSVDLFRLIRDFVATTSCPAIFGTDFTENNPSIWTDLWQLDAAAHLLELDLLPSFFPVPKLMRAAIAKHRLHSSMLSFEQALDAWSRDQDPGSEWASLDDVSPLLRAHLSVYAQHGLAISARAANELALLHASTANSSALIFWLVLRISADAQLLSDIRAEVRPHLHIHVPASQDLPVYEPPVLQGVDATALAAQCPLLNAAMEESLRLDTCVWSSRIVRDDCVIRGKGRDYVLRRGEYAHVAHELHHLDPAVWDEPDVWRVERHLVYGADGAAVRAVPSRVQAFGQYCFMIVQRRMAHTNAGGGASLCPGKAYASKQVLVFAACILTFWDIEPANASWEMPSSVMSSGGVNRIKGEMRAKVCRRDLPAMSP